MGVKTSDGQLPGVSIVMVNYNGIRWLELFLDSLYNTVYPNYEIIVVDNASTDDSVQFLKKKSERTRVIELGENKGYGQAANAGACVAAGEILAFVNNDMEFRSDWLINAVKKLISNRTAGAVQCKLLHHKDRQRIDSIGLSVDRYNLPLVIGHDEIDRGQYDNLPEIGACTGGAMVVWKSIFLAVGAFDPVYFMYYEDVDLSWRIRMSGLRILPAPSSVIYHMGSVTSIKNLDSSQEYWLSPFLAFHTTKNYVYCWLKNSELRVVFLYWPVVLFIVLARVSFGIMNQRKSVVMSHMRGFLWNLNHLRLIVKRRADIKKLRRVSSVDMLIAFGNQRSSNLFTWIRFSIGIVKRRNVSD